MYIQSRDTLNLSLSSVLNNIETAALYDSTSALELEDIDRLWEQSTYIEADRFNPENGQYWLNIDVHNTDSLDGEWLVSFHDWKKVTLYIEDASSGIDIKRTGFHMPFRQRDYPFADNSHILLKLKAGQTKNLKIRLEAGSDQWRKPTRLSFDIAPRVHVDRQNHRDELIIGIFGGIFLILFFYNLFIYFSTRDFEYLLYLGRIIVLGYTLNANSGYIVSMLSGLEQFPLYKGMVGSIMSGIGPATMILFTMYFLSTSTYLPFWHKVLKYLLAGIGVMVIGVNINYAVFGPLTYLLSLALTTTFIIIGVKSILRKVPSAWYYLIAYTFSTAAMFVVIFAFAGLIPKNEFTVNYALPTGYALELLFFSFALANKINILRRKSESQQSEIITHLREKEQMQQNITTELERKVKERTREINEQKELIELERQKSETLLMNILPQESVLELKETGASKPRTHQNTSVLFADFKGFTNTASTIPAERLIEELNDIFQNFDEIIMHNGVEKIKTIGDAYMAVAGLYNTDENHAVQAIQAAIDMQKYLEKRNADAAIKWNIRIGIHSGTVISGIVGKNKFTFDIWGDTVNIASRLESQCEIREINVSAYTYDLAKEAFRGKYRGKIDAKGKGEIDMYYIEYH